MSVQYQESNVDERISYQLGPDDSRFEIIQKFDPGMNVHSNVTNLDDSLSMEVVVLMVDIAPPAMENGSIDWSIVKSLGEVHVIEAQSTLQLVIEAPMVFHYVMMHNPSENTTGDVIQVRVLNDYHQDLMGQAIALSLTSLWMTGFVINRIRRLKKYGRKFYDSTPSHLWEDE